MSSPAVGGVFISYRRRESSGITGRLYDRLAARFGDNQVFMDVDTIALGVDFTQAIVQAVSNCTVLLAVIGPGWLTAADEDGQRRLDDPDDIVRLEIQAALERDIRVIPILVESAEMPRPRQLPEELAGLARRNAHFLRHESFRSDADRLLEAIEPILASASASQVASSPARVVPVATDPPEVASGGQPRQEEADRRAQEETDRKAQQEAQRKVRQEEAQRKAQKKTDRQAREDADRQAGGRVRQQLATLQGVLPGQPSEILPNQMNSVYGVAFSPDRRLLASCGSGERVHLWDPSSGWYLRTLTGNRLLGHGGGDIHGVAFSPDGRLLASCGGGMVSLWDPAKGKRRTTLGYDRKSMEVFGVTFAPTGRVLATCGADMTVRLWGASNYKLIVALTGHTGMVFDVAFSPDGRLLASCSEDKTVRLWDMLNNGAHRRTLTGHTGTVNHVAFSPDGRLLASRSASSLQLWDPVSGEQRHVLTGLANRGVGGVAFSPDGRLLANGNEKTVQLWDPVSGELLDTLTGHKGTVFGVAFSPDGRLLASYGSEGTVHLWALASAQ